MGRGHERESVCAREGVGEIVCVRESVHRRKCVYKDIE